MAAHPDITRFSGSLLGYRRFTGIIPSSQKDPSCSFLNFLPPPDEKVEIILQSLIVRVQFEGLLSLFHGAVHLTKMPGSDRAQIKQPEPQARSVIEITGVLKPKPPARLALFLRFFRRYQNPFRRCLNSA
jgi:hypothetical protein